GLRLRHRGGRGRDRVDGQALHGVAPCGETGGGAGAAVLRPDQPDQRGAGRGLAVFAFNGDHRAGQLPAGAAEARMIPSDHFTRFYNEVFKFLEAQGEEHLEAYFLAISKNQEKHILELIQTRGFEGMEEYWTHIKIEENCDMDI